MTPTLVIEGYDDDLELYAGTIIADGEPMQVWVPDDLAEEAMDRVSLAASPEGEARAGGDCRPAPVRRNPSDSEAPK